MIGMNYLIDGSPPVFANERNEAPDTECPAVWFRDMLGAMPGWLQNELIIEDPVFMFAHPDKDEFMIWDAGSQWRLPHIREILFDYSDTGGWL